MKGLCLSKLKIKFAQFYRRILVLNGVEGYLEGSLLRAMGFGQQVCIQSR